VDVLTPASMENQHTVTVMLCSKLLLTMFMVPSFMALQRSPRLWEEATGLAKDVESAGKFKDGVM